MISQGGQSVEDFGFLGSACKSCNVGVNPVPIPPPNHAMLV